MAANSDSNTYDCISGVSRYLRDMRPAHYTLKIDSFSQFLETFSDTCYTSKRFEVAGYKWKLCLYPNGDEDRNGKGHISMFLIIKDTKSLPLGWEVNVNYKFFVFDHIRNKYLSIQDASGRISQFDARKREWGISQLLPNTEFIKPQNGFIFRDECIFGAEICVVQSCIHAGENIFSVKDFKVYTFKWEVSPFSSSEECYSSDIFTVRDIKWKLLCYPKGGDSGNDNCLSIGLEVVDLKASQQVYAAFDIYIHDQCCSKLHGKGTDCSLFKASATDWGFLNFLSLTELYDPSKGFLLNNKVIFEVQIKRMFSRESLE